MRILALFLSSVVVGVGMLSAFTPACYAGTGDGGGGASVICFDSAATLAKVKSPAQGGSLGDDDVAKIKFIETYDLYMARKSGAPVPLLEEERGKEALASGYDAYIGRIAKRFEKTTPSVTDFILAGRENRSHAEVSLGEGVAQVQDAHELEVPNASVCALVTTAIQKTIGGRLEIHFDSRLVKHKKNSELSRAVLNLHEDLYSMISSKIHDSTDIRALIIKALQIKVPETEASMNLYVRALDLNGFFDERVAYDHPWDTYSVKQEWGLRQLGLGEERQAFQMAKCVLGSVMEAARHMTPSLGDDVAINPEVIAGYFRTLWPQWQSKFKADPSINPRVVDLLDPLFSTARYDNSYDPNGPGLIFGNPPPYTLKAHWFNRVTPGDLKSDEQAGGLNLVKRTALDILKESGLWPGGSLEKISDGPATSD